MPPNRPITIGGRSYDRNPEVDRYQIPLDGLADLRMCDVPPHSHLEIMGLPRPKDVSSLEVFALNGGEEGDYEYLSVYGGASYVVPADENARIVSKLRRAFPDAHAFRPGFIANPSVHVEAVEEGVHAHVFLHLDFNEKPETPVRDAIIPFIDGFRRLDVPGVHAFICHASEDKPAARDLAHAMRRLGAEVWLDEWEIRVGDSIVQRVSDALGTVSHLIVLLSHNSVTKPWVRKELSSALMRQLSQEAIRVLPIRLDDCAIPPILSDLKYADARKGWQRAVAEIEEALFAD